MKADITNPEYIKFIEDQDRTQMENKIMGREMPEDEVLDSSENVGEIDNMVILEAPEGVSEPNFQILIDILEYKRPDGSRCEQRMINRFIRPTGAKPDGAGNYILEIPRPDGFPNRVMFSAHTDTVHSHNGKQELIIEKDRFLRLRDEPSRRESSCLGADNGAGVWLLLELIYNNVPGLYVFHRGEEIGRVGSKWLAKNTPEMLQGIEIALAFDRRDTCSVITHQMSQRCCSSAFAKEFISQVSGYVDLHEDDGGSYTDTASYMDMISECTNISVGFQNEHTDCEFLDCIYLINLRNALLSVDWDRLPAQRDPKVVEYVAWGNMCYSGRKYNSKYDSNYDSKDNEPGYWNRDLQRYVFADDDDDSESYNQLTMIQLVKEYPEVVADMLEGYGISVEDIADEVRRMNYMMR